MILREIGFAKNYQKIVERKCDYCNKVEEARWSSIRESRKRRGCDLDVCSDCARKMRVLPKGNEHGAWKHGLSDTGYDRITDQKGRRTYRQRVVMQDYLGRDLLDDEIVHHINLIKTDNDIENLCLLKNKSEHMKCHASLEDVGFSMFGNGIWFDPVECIYIDEPVGFVPPFTDISDLIGMKKYQKTDKRKGTTYEFLFVRQPNGWTWKRYHVAIAERLLGRRLLKNEGVHHIDGNSLNNDPHNLFVMSSSEHTKCHHSLQKCVVKKMDLGLVVFDRNEKIYKKGE